MWFGEALQLPSRAVTSLLRKISLLLLSREQDITRAGCNKLQPVGETVMRGMRRVGIGVILVIGIMTTISGSVWAQEPFQLVPHAQFRFGMDRGVMLISGETLIPAGGKPGSGTRVDVASELGVVSGESSAVIFRGTIRDNHLLNFCYFSTLPTGVRRIAHPFRFQNKTYPEGSLLETRIDFNWLEFSYGYQVLKPSAVKIGPRIGVQYVNCAATINGESEEAGVISNTRRLDAIYPVLGVEARYLMPHGLDLSVEMEGMHLITRGFLAVFKIGVLWETYPNVILSAEASSRVVQYVEDNQVLNNQWTYSLTGFSMGMMFGF